MHITWFIDPVLQKNILEELEATATVEYYVYDALKINTSTS